MAHNFEDVFVGRSNSEDDSQSEYRYDEKSLLGHREPASLFQTKQGQGRAVITQYSTLCLLVFSVLLNIAAWTQISRAQDHTKKQHDSPVVRDIGENYLTTFINGTLEKRNIYRQPPSKEVDDAWLALGSNAGSIVVPVEQATQYGIESGQVQRIHEQGGGYMADVYIFHNMHCLNLIRQTSRWNWDHYRAKAGTEEAEGTAFEGYDGEESLELHFSHCLDMLRQEIMCHANTDIFSQWYIKDFGADKNFSFTTECKDYDAILEWYEKNGVDMSTTLIRKRPDSTVLDERP